MNTWSLALMLWLLHKFVQVNESYWNWGSDTKTTAHGTKRSLQSFGIMFSFTALKNSLDYLKCLSAKLQKRYIDVFEAYTMIDNIKSKIQVFFYECHWYKRCDEAKQLAS